MVEEVSLPEDNFQLNRFTIITLTFLTVVLSLISFYFITRITGSVIGEARSNYYLISIFIALFLVFAIIEFYIVIFPRIKRRSVNISKLVEEAKQEGY